MTRSNVNTAFNVIHQALMAGGYATHHVSLSSSLGPCQFVPTTHCLQTSAHSGVVC